MKMLFNKIKDEDFEKVWNIQKNTQYNGCEWSRLYLKAWDFFMYDKMEIAFEGDVAFIRFPVFYKDAEFFKNLTHIYLPPMCTLDKVKGAIDLARAQAKEDKEVFAMIGVPQEYMDAYGECDLSVTHSQNQDEYLYLPEDLALLRGKKYHSKRNHISAFDRLYNYTFRPYEEKDRDDVENLLLKWEQKQDEEYVENDENSEVLALESSLDMAFDENIVAYVLCVDDKIIGFTLGEHSPSGVGMIHIEKADTEYNGAYTKLMNSFILAQFQNERIINRQEDMGDEGLRQSKLSYKPVGFCKKYFLKDLNV